MATTERFDTFEVSRAHLVPGETWRDLMVSCRRPAADGEEPEYVTIPLTYDEALGLAVELITHMPDHVRDTCLALVHHDRTVRDGGAVAWLAGTAPLPPDETA